MNVETVLERRNDMLVTFRVLQNIRNPFSVAAIQEREDLERDLEAYRVARAAFLEHRRHQRTAAALAEAQAEVARLRAALKAIISVVVPAERFERKIYDASLEIDVYTDVLRIARAALKTAPAGGA